MTTPTPATASSSPAVAAEFVTQFGTRRLRDAHGAPEGRRSNAGGKLSYWPHLVAADAVSAAAGVYAIYSYWGQNPGKPAENVEAASARVRQPLDVKFFAEGAKSPSRCAGSAS